MSSRLLPVLALASLTVASACGDSANTDDDVTSVSATDVAVSSDAPLDPAPLDSPSSFATTTPGSSNPTDDVGTRSETAPDPTPTGPSSTSETIMPRASSPTTGLDLADTYLGDYTLIDEFFGTEVTVTLSNGTRTIQANSLPNHETGTFPNAGNPNAIAEQSITWSFPTEATWTGVAADVRTTGVALNGVKFEPGTAERITCSSGESLRIEALQSLYDLGFDMNNAHVQPNGEYHYHGISPLLVDAFDDDRDLVLLGFAADGHLIVYSKSGAYRSGYTLSSTPRTGTDCAPSLRGADEIDLAGTTPDGTYTSDWAYAGGSGTLDECNGTTIDGTYVYLVTDSYPFIPRCLFGTFTESGAPAGIDGPPGAPTGQEPAGIDAISGPPGTAGPVDLVRVAEELGVDVDELREALGPPPPDLEAAALRLGVDVEDLRRALGPPQDPMGLPEAAVR